MSEQTDKSQFTIKDSYSFAELQDLVAFLQGPQGCPWDRQQTHQSIKTALIDEAWEAVDAIESGQAERLADELGDVLMQVVFHAELGAREGSFTMDDVLRAICHKLISRHSHIFGEDKVENADEVLKTWEANKKVEKGLQSETEVLQDVPRHLPSLMRAYKVQKKAAHCGFDWPDYQGAFAKVCEEAQELGAAQEQLALEQNKGLKERKKARVTEEAGDLLFAVVNLLRHLKIDPEIAMQAATDKFIRRFAAMENLASKRGEGLRDLDLKQLDQLWEEIKGQENV